MSFDAPLPYGGKEVEGLAARGTLRIYLEKEVEMTALDFFAFAGNLLEQTGVKSVYNVWFDHEVIYRVSKDLEQADNHKVALAEATSFSESSKGHSKEVGVWSHGMSGDFYLEFRLRFWRVRERRSTPDSH